MTSTQALGKPISAMILLLLLVVFPTTVAQDTSSATTPPRKDNDGDQAFALYTLPPFTVSFTSDYALNGLPANVEERGKLLAPTLHQPLRIVTGEFLMETVRLELASPRNNNKNASLAVRNMVENFLTLDLQVAVRSVEHLDLTDADWDRENADSGTAAAVDGDNNLRRRELLDDLPSGARSRANPSEPKQLLQFRADFFTTAAFLEPSSSTTTTTSTDLSGKPSNEEVSDVMGNWIDQAFIQDKPYYFTALQNSDNSVLKHLEQLHVETDSKAVFDPSATGTMSSKHSGGSSGSVAGNNENADGTETAQVAAPQDNSNETTSKARSWTPSEKLFFTILVCVATVSIAGLLFAISYYTKRGERRWAANHGNGASSHHHYDDEEIIGGRHSDEIMEVLHASDRYLATHRPDLLEKYGGGSGHSEGNDGSTPLVPVAVENNDGSGGAAAASNAPPERRYVTPTNPFQYLYGASYFHRDRQAVEEDRAKNRHRHRSEDPMDNVELQEPVPADELPQEDDQAVSGYLQSWFQRVVGRRVLSARTEEQELNQEHYYDEDKRLDENNTSGVAEEYGELACEQDPSGYDFAFSDFPRQDGTPCLIYEETLEEDEEEQYLNNNGNRLNYSTSSFGNSNYINHDPLTDDEFQQALSQHERSTQYYNSNYNNSSSSFDPHAPTENDSVTETTAAGTDSLVDTSEEPATLQDTEDDPSQFTNKLERLVAMRHRHYEKQRIVEKHREQRRQERAKQRALQQQEENEKRDRLLRRHSMELDIQALEANIHRQSASSSSFLKPPSSTSKVTPTSATSSNDGDHNAQASWHQSPEQLWSVKKPKLHRRTSSEADAGVINVQTPPSSGLKTNRSMDEELDDTMKNGNTSKITIQDESAMAKENNGRVVQSVRKQSRLQNNNGKGIPNDVFRPIEAQDMAVISPTGSPLTETGSSTAPSSCGDGSHSTARATPPLVLGSNSVKNGSSARKNKRPISSASFALAQGFQARGRSMSFGNLEEKKMDDSMSGGRAGTTTNTIDGGGGKQPMPPSHQLPQRSSSMNRHRRSNSSSPAEDLSVHGIYAQFV